MRISDWSSDVCSSDLEKHYPEEEKRGKLRLILSPDGQDGSLTIGQDARVYAGLLDGDEKVEQPLAAGRHAYVHVARGQLSLNGLQLSAGDGVKIADETLLTLADGKDRQSTRLNSSH